METGGFFKGSEMVDYKLLWEQLKEDLERWERQGGFDCPFAIGDGIAAEVLEIMTRREEQS